MTDREKQIAFLLATSQYLIPAWECTYEEAAKDLVANGVTVQKHGRWEHLDDDLVDLWKCTACGEEWAFGYDPTSAETTVPFCPDCGARMDGE